MRKYSTPQMGAQRYPGNVHNRPHNYTMSQHRRQQFNISPCKILHYINMAGFFAILGIRLLTFATAYTQLKFAAICTQSFYQTSQQPRKAICFTAFIKVLSKF
jgi:hypothetical protein